MTRMTDLKELDRERIEISLGALGSILAYVDLWEIRLIAMRHHFPETEQILSQFRKEFEITRDKIRLTQDKIKQEIKPDDQSKIQT